MGFLFSTFPRVSFSSRIPIRSVPFPSGFPARPSFPNGSPLMGNPEKKAHSHLKSGQPLSDFKNSAAIIILAAHHRLSSIVYCLSSDAEENNFRQREFPQIAYIINFLFHPCLIYKFYCSFRLLCLSFPLWIDAFWECAAFLRRTMELHLYFLFLKRKSIKKKRFLPSFPEFPPAFHLPIFNLISFAKVKPPYFPPADLGVK